MELSKESDKWLDDNSICGLDFYSETGGEWGIPLALVEEKVAELEARLGDSAKQVTRLVKGNLEQGSYIFELEAEIAKLKSAMERAISDSVSPNPARAYDTLQEALKGSE